MDITCPALVRWNPSYMDVSSILLDIEYDAQAKTKREEIDRLAAASDEAARKAISDGHVIELWGSGGRPRGRSWAVHVRQTHPAGHSGKVRSISLGPDGMEIEVDAILCQRTVTCGCSYRRTGWLLANRRARSIESALKEVAAKAVLRRFALACGPTKVLQVPPSMWATARLCSQSTRCRSQTCHYSARQSCSGYWRRGTWMRSFAFCRCFSTFGLGDTA